MRSNGGGGVVVKWGLTLCNTIGCSPPDSSIHGIFPGKNTGVGCRFLLQGIFPTQGQNPSLSPALQADSLPMEPPGKPYEKHINVQNKAITLEIWCLSIHVCKRMIYYDSLQFLPIRNRRFHKHCQKNFFKIRVIIKIMLIIHLQLAIE